MTLPYQPPFDVTPSILAAVAEISEICGALEGIAVANADSTSVPHLRREHRIKTVQASLEIENNTLTLEQVTAVLEGKRVLGRPREIQEVRNAFAAYERLFDWNPADPQALLEAHRVLMEGAGRVPFQEVALSKCVRLARRLENTVP